MNTNAYTRVPRIDDLKTDPRMAMVQYALNPMDIVASTKNPGGIKEMFGNLWNKTSGIQPMRLGNIANVGSGLMYGTQAISGLSDISNNTRESRDLQGDILKEAMANPINSSFLSSDQKVLLNKIRRGNYSLDGDNGIGEGVLSGLGNTLMGTVTGGLTGGIPGAIIGGIGGLVNSGISGYSNAQQRNIGELEALYQALADANAQYQTMKRPNFTGLGIQQRYKDMYR